MSEKELQKEFELTEKTISILEKYYNLIIEKNKVMNLTSITDKEEFYLKHFCDSLYLNKAINLNKNLNMCDFGTGAGFPGIVLKIVYPNLNIELIESSKKKCEFLNNIIKDLDLKNIKVICDRMENYSKNNEEKYDYIVCRAVAKTGILSEIAAKAIKIKGFLICMKSNYEKEINNIKNIKKLGMELENIIEFDLKENKRSLIKIKKTKKTNNLYPRNYNLIKKRPIF